MKARSSTRKPKPAKEPRYSRTHAPGGVAAEDWQRALRRQFGREQDFELENLGGQTFFSEFRVGNPQTRASYRVAIRGLAAGENRCTCPDYATNELGTCKHIEFVLGRLTARRGAKAAFARGWQPVGSEVYMRHGAVRAVHFRAGADCPAPVREAAAALFDASRGHALPDERIGELEGFLQLAARSGHELRAHDDALDHVAARRDAARRAGMLERLFPRGAADPRLLQGLKVPLYPYQAEGALFAVRAGRALIGDEMGLGKTVQAIAAMEILARHFGVGRVLVVCPTSLKYQWQSELARFAGREARVVSGGRLQRQKDYAAEDFCKITNYEKLDPDLDLIDAWGPELVIVDEAQRIKNWNTIAARALKRIDSAYALVLTGTPLENKLEELISIVQFVDQHRLGPTWKLLHEHQTRDETGRVTGYVGLDRIGRTLAPVMLRRRRAEVLTQLPGRTDQHLLVPMTGPQMAYHADAADTVARIVSRWRRMKFLSDQDQRRLTAALQTMRMACNSTYLIDQETDHGVKADELAALLEGVLAQPQEKVVVFSQWVRTHEIVMRRLEARGIGHVCFHGGVPSEQRPALVQRFRDDPQCRVFLATDAGAAGLNLQHASTLVSMDLPWNPALLEQRIGRIHRMGQRQPVRIVNFVAKGTIEEGMLSVLAFKRSLSAGILDGGQGEIALGGSRLSRFMKDVETVTTRMGAAEPVTPAEEAWGAAPQDAVPAAPVAGGEEASPAAPTRPGPPLGVAGDAPASAPPEAADPLPGDAATADAGQWSASPPPAAALAADPWGALLQAGAQLAAALGAASDERAAPHPWVEHDPVTGARSLRVPLPPPQVASQLADALGALARVLGGAGR